jgi:peroxiredoxin
VVAVSADPPALTAERYREFGRFGFPVVSDPDNRVAEQYRVYRPPTPEKPGNLDHATFVLGADGRVLWADSGPEPFLDNKTLLTELARGRGVAPARTHPSRAGLAAAR